MWSGRLCPFSAFYSRLQPPIIELLLCDQERGGIFEEIQYAGSVESNAEESVNSRQHQRQGDTGLGQRQNRDKKPHADDADVPQLPKPQHGFCGQIIRVNINCSHLRRIEMAAGFPAAIQWVDYSSALSSACWISCVMKSFCFR